jgi:hypothetical protein
MTTAEYYAAARSFGLRESKTPGVWIHRNREFINVPDPDCLSPENRRFTINKLRELLGE